MSNKTGTIKIGLSYVDASALPAKTPDYAVVFPYQAQAHGALDVPDAETTTTVHTVPFGGVGVEATAVLVVNRTNNGANPGQDMILKINGSAALQRIPPGGAFLVANPVVVGGTPITAVTLTSTGTQAGPGEIEFHVFGDPV